MPAIAWVMLAAGAVLGGGLGYVAGLWRGRKGATEAAVSASVAEQKQAVVTAAEAKAAIEEKAAAAAAAIPGESPEQVLADLGKLK